MKIETTLATLGFEKSEENNLYYRPAEEKNYDVIRYMSDDELYNICINETQLMAILTK